MKRLFAISLSAGLATLLLAQSLWAFEMAPRRRADYPCWSHPYYEAGWGMPLALVVPPTAEFQTHWGWGIGNTRISPINPQFQSDYPGPGYYDRRQYRPTPPWPSDTDQFGVYYIRGPW
jgi:hypothetical protein